MKRLIYTIAFSTLLACMLAMPVFGQAGDRPILRDVVQKELERTDALIDRAKEVNPGIGVDVPNKALSSAITVQEKAWEQFHLNALRVARQLTLEARELAKQSLAGARVAERGQEELSRRLDKAEDALNRIGDDIGSMNDRPALTSLYQLTRENLRRAREFYDSQNYLASFRLLDQVERAIWRLSRAVHREGRWFEQYENRALQVSDLIDRVKEQTIDCDDKDARELIRQAEDSFRQAEEFAEKDQLRPALGALQRAQEAANDAARKCMGPSSLERIYERIQAQYERLSKELNSNDESAAKLLGQANDQLRLARRHLDAGDLEHAAAALRGAQLALRQAADYLGSDEL